MRYLILFGIIIINVIFTGAVFTNINVLDIAPDIIICTISSIAILEKRMAGAVIGLFCGLLLDILFTGAIGFYAIPYFATGAAAYFVSIRLSYIDRYIVPCCFAAAALLLKEFFSAILTYMLGINFSFWHKLIRYMLPEALFTGVFMLLIYFLFRRLYRLVAIRPKNLEDLKRLL